MDEVQCDGDESRLVDCTFPGFGTVTCASNRAVEIDCLKQNPDPMPQQGDLRFGYVRTETAERVRGLVEVFNAGYWGRVCDDNFDVFDASVVCRQLEYSSIGTLVVVHNDTVHDTYLSLSHTILCNVLYFEILIDAFVYPNIAVDLNTGIIWLDEVQCDGTESALVDCTSPGVGVVDCPANRAVEVDCTRQNPDPLPAQGDIRFRSVRVENASTIRGLIEVFHAGVWGSVCDDGFDVSDAAIACAQLGYSSNGTVGLSLNECGVSS